MTNPTDPRVEAAARVIRRLTSPSTAAPISSITEWAAEILKAADEAAWQPIESVPVEETIDIWVQHKDGSHREPEVMLSDDRKRWVINLDEWDAGEINATHWRPRPAPPQEGK